jgi:HD-GYP domain-containing protein (c-di-GMP phosphodiesterase class II)
VDQHAKALALILREEFDEPFLFQDARSGAVVLAADGRALALPAAEVTEVAAAGQARVQALPDGGYRVSLPLYASRQPILVGSARLGGLAAGHDEAAREARRLAKWAQSVCQRLRSSDHILSRDSGKEEDRAQGRVAWEAILRLDHLLRHLRAHKNPQGSQGRVLQAVFDLLNVECLAWVPCDAASEPAVLGEPVLAGPDYRQLALALSKNSELRPTNPLLVNDFPSTSGSARFATLNNVMAFLVAADQKPLGWVLALNKKAAKGRASALGAERLQPLVALGAERPQTPGEENGPQFRHSDAALLTPFVALLGMQSRAAARYLDLKDLLVGLTRSLTAALDAKDAYTFGHSERVARIAVELGRELGLDEDDLGNVYLAGLLHDIGKIGVRDAVLTKPGALTPEEYDEVKQHVTIGYAILADLHQIRDLLPGVLYHHEHFDGSGYPDGLAGEAIPFLARILAVADAYDAMSTSRPYRPAMPCSRVEEILAEGAGSHWDRRVIDAFLRCRQKIYTIRQRGVGASLRQALDGALHPDDSGSVAVPCLKFGAST